MPNAAFVRVITLSAPNLPSWSAPFTSPAASSNASTEPLRASASRRAPVTTWWTTLGTGRRPARARQGLRRRSQHLRFLAQQAHQLGHGRGALAHDLPFLALGGRAHGHDLERPRPEGYRLHIERLFLRRHDPLERGIAWLVESLVGGEDRGKRELHHFEPALDLPLGDALAALDLEVGHGGDARQVEQPGDHRPHLMVVVVDGHLAEQDEIE